MVTGDFNVFPIPTLHKLFVLLFSKNHKNETCYASTRVGVLPEGRAESICAV